MKFRDHAPGVFPKFGIAFAEIIHVIRSHVVAFADGIHLGLDLPAEEAAIILARLHHHGKAGQLRGTVIDIKPEKIVYQNAGNSCSIVITACPIDLHQDIEHVDQNMAAPHAGVDDLQFFGIAAGHRLI